MSTEKLSNLTKTPISKSTIVSPHLFSSDNVNLYMPSDQMDIDLKKVIEKLSTH